MTEAFPILFGSRWRARGLDESITSLDRDALCAEYRALREAAPRRSRVGKSYFIGHSGVPSATGCSNRLEEHCAIALFNLERRWPRAKGGWFRLLDYQVPIKAQQSDAGIGKIDLIGATDEGRLMIIELKVKSHGGGRSDAPPAALMEGLRYAAMVEADLDAIASEAESLFGAKIVRVPPIVQLLAPKTWWRSWLDLAPAGNWRPAFARLAKAVETKIRVTVECVAFDDVEIAYGVDGQAPTIDRNPAIYAVELDQETPIGEAIAETV